MIDYDEIDADVITELVALRRMKKIMDGHKATMNALAYFQSLPKKNVVFIMGNHDPGILFSSVQELIRDYVGEDVRFYLEAYQFDGVYVEHGNQYEVANAFDREKYFLRKSLPQPVLNQPWGTVFLVQVINTVKRERRHFDKVLPFGRYLKWLLLYDIRFFFRIFFMMIRFFFVSRFRNDPRRNTSFRQTLEIALEAPIFPDLDDAAEKILLMRDDIHTVIFGHNHRPELKQVAPGKIYVNTGTWNEMTHLDLDRLGTRLACTFALVEYIDGQAQTSLKVWKGKPKLTTEADVA